MEIAEQHAGEITVVEVTGRIDSNTAKAFGERLTGLIKDGRARLVVDLKQIIYISSAGFRALLLADKLAGRRCRCRGSPRSTACDPGTPAPRLDTRREYRG